MITELAAATGIAPWVLAEAPDWTWLETLADVVRKSGGRHG